MLETSGLGYAGPVVPCSVSEQLLSMGASAETRASKKKMGKEKPKTPWPALRREAGVLQVILSTLLVLALFWCCLH